MNHFPGSEFLPALAGAVLLFLFVMGGLIYFFLKLLMANTGGSWSKLAQRYAVTQEPDGLTISRRQTIQVGSTVIQRIAEVGVGPRGLFLNFPWRGAVFIPWSDVSAANPTTLHWQPAIQLAVGEPLLAMVTLKEPLGQSVLAYLSRSRDKSRTAVSGQ